MIHLSNKNIKRILMGTPHNHKHMRVVIETSENDQIVLQEACVANIVRAYTTIKTHPMQRAIELKTTILKDKKLGYSQFQAIETERMDEDIESELNTLLFP